MGLEIKFTMLSKATVMSIKKKRAAHSCGKGIRVMASGYATNTSPGPEIENRTLEMIFITKLIEV